jgi:hypothetical protein
VAERLVALPPEKLGERPMANLLPFFQVLRSITMQPRWAKRLIAHAIPFMTLGNPIWSGKSSRSGSSKWLATASATPMNYACEH